MHPAASVIGFTTASGAGYGLAIMTACFALAGILPADAMFALVTVGLAFVLITGGLLTSTFHLGHPERAWRALSQWRSSWLSREGVLALFTYLPAGLYAGAWVVFGQNRGGLVSGAGILVIASALATVFATSMIYASLKPIRAWNNPFVPACYVVFSLMTGGYILSALSHIWHLGDAIIHMSAIALALAGLVLKVLYWRSIDAGASLSTPASAIGMDEGTRVRMLESPHSMDNYLLKEMGFHIARKHARTLRYWTLRLAFILPALLILLSVLLPPLMAAILSGLAVISGGIGIIIERWLFFAEARHTVSFYYGAQTA